MNYPENPLILTILIKILAILVKIPVFCGSDAGFQGSVGQ
jgi:biotin transporter BioY